MKGFTSRRKRDQQRVDKAFRLAVGERAIRRELRQKFLAAADDLFDTARAKAPGDALITKIDFDVDVTFLTHWERP